MFPFILKSSSNFKNRKNALCLIPVYLVLGHISFDYKKKHQSAFIDIFQHVGEIYTDLTKVASQCSLTMINLFDETIDVIASMNRILKFDGRSILWKISFQKQKLYAEVFL